MSCGRGIEIAGLPLLGIAGPSLKQGAAGTRYFEPGGVSFARSLLRSRLAFFANLLQYRLTNE
jgi:hypothetical protein